MRLPGITTESLVALVYAVDNLCFYHIYFCHLFVTTLTMRLLPCMFDCGDTAPKILHGKLITEVFIERIAYVRC
jgi:hypothetical protein